jgi:hypothetical protein
MTITASRQRADELNRLIRSGVSIREAFARVWPDHITALHEVLDDGGHAVGPDHERSPESAVPGVGENTTPSTTVEAARCSCNGMH